VWSDPACLKGASGVAARSSKLVPLTRTDPDLRSAAIGAMREDCPEWLEYGPLSSSPRNIAVNNDEKWIDHEARGPIQAFNLYDCEIGAMPCPPTDAGVNSRADSRATLNGRT
jgi:hypothetical protein